MFKKKILLQSDIKHIYCIKEVTDNIIHYHNHLDDGYASVYRINGFNPALLQQSDRDNATQQLIRFFDAKFRYKIISCQVSFDIPDKKFSSKSAFPGIYLTETKYVDAMSDINGSVNLKERAYFVILESNSPQLNNENFYIMASQAQEAHCPMQPASENEMKQLINKF
jgi:hypothetical protein